MYRIGEEMKKINDQQFKEETSQGLALIDFWAPWCGPCKMQAPILDELEAEMGDKVSIFKLNVDDNPVTASEFGVMSIPTLMISSQEQKMFLAFFFAMNEVIYDIFRFICRDWWFSLRYGTSGPSLYRLL